jgi:hypothetical protein
MAQRKHSHSKKGEMKVSKGGMGPKPDRKPAGLTINPVASG